MRQRQSATSIRGLFSCFNELREAGRTLQVQGWVDCADHWAKAQGGLLDQSATPDLVQESVSAGLLLGSDVGKALLRVEYIQSSCKPPILSASRKLRPLAS